LWDKGKPGSHYNISGVPPSQFVDADYRYPSGIEETGGVTLRRTGQGGFAPDPGAKLEVGVGDEVFFVGLFVQHAGEARNLPMARFGHISRMPVEPIEVQ